MSSAGPWSVKGIDPKAREIAKDLARRSGMTLGEWLNQMIIDGGDAEPPPYAPEPEPAPRRPVLQAGPQNRAEPVRRLYEEPASEAELARVARALDVFSSRLEAAEHRSTLAISGIDQSVMGVLSRLDSLEREQNAVGAGFEGSLDEVRSTQAKLADRIRRMEDEDGPRVEAMKALEASLSKVASQIYEGESRSRGSIAEVRQDLSGLSRRMDRLDADLASKADAGDRYTSADLVEQVVARISARLDEAESRTSAAVRALETSFAGLDARLTSAEARQGADVETHELRFQRLATDLSERFEASRAELATQLRAAADGKLDRMETALRDLSGQVEAAEKKSAEAIERMGREVVRIAQTLGQRISNVDARSVKTAEQMGSEMARIAEAMETRMRNADSAQAQALEKLGGEIGRIAERLAERIAASDRRASTAIDEVGDQVARITDKVNQRHDRTASELADRIRQSEERTARLLEEARETIDRRLAETQRRPAEAAPQAIAAPPAPIEDFDDEPFAPPAATAPAGFAEPESADPFADDPFAASEAATAPPPPIEDEIFDDEEPPPAAKAAPRAAEAFTPPPIYSDDPPPQPVQARASTRELIEAARAAARQAAAPEGRRRKAAEEVFTRSAPVPPLEEPLGGRGLGALGGFRVGKRKKKETSTVLRTAVLASATAACLSTAAVGAFLLTNGSKEESTGPAEAPVAPPVQKAAAAPAPAASDTDFLASALTPPPATEAVPELADAAPAEAAAEPAPAPAAQRARPAPARPRTEARPAAPTSADPRALYSAAVRRIESGDNTGVETLRRAANLGHAPAQFYLAKLYEAGSAGVKRDAGEARRWTERAAQSGDAKAMHNLGLYYFEGVGGEKSPAIAATWFLRAANAGLGDSQYNLARLYEQGYGVAQNPPEAYKWYLIAAAGGDKEAKDGAERVRKQLTPDSLAAAQRSASAFRPQQGPALAAR